MVDIMTAEARSAFMSKVKTKNTKPELKVRKILHAAGLRYRLHRSDLPGSPDIVLPRFRICIFVHGCFWHGHDGCSKAKLPSTRVDFWAEKIKKNRDRDVQSIKNLIKQDWDVEIIWECETKSKKTLLAVLEKRILEKTVSSKEIKKLEPINIIS